MKSLRVLKITNDNSNKNNLLVTILWSRLKLDSPKYIENSTELDEVGEGSLPKSKKLFDEKQKMANLVEFNEKTAKKCV